MTTDHTPAEAGTDPRLALLDAARRSGTSTWRDGFLAAAAADISMVLNLYVNKPETSPESMGPDEAAQRLDKAQATISAHRCPPSVVPGDTATEGGDVRERAREVAATVPKDEDDGDAIVDALAAAGLLATAGSEGEAERNAELDAAVGALAGMVESSPESTAAVIERWPGLAHGIDRVTRFADPPVDVYAHRAASPQGEAQGQCEDVRVWQRSDGRLAIRDEHGRYGSDVFWLDDMDTPPTDAVPLVAAPRAVAPVGNVDREAEPLLTDDECAALATELHQVDCGCADYGDPWTDEDDRYIKAAMAASQARGAALRGEKGGV